MAATARRLVRVGGAAAWIAMVLGGCRAMGPIGTAGPSLVVPTYSYASGTASQGFARTRGEVEAALGEAMEDLAIERVGLVQADGEQTRVHGRSPDGRKVEFALLDHGAATEARVRVGLFGDEAMAKAVLDRLGVRLGTLPPEAVPAELPTDPEGNPFFSRQAVPDDVMLRGFDDAAGTASPLP